MANPIDLHALANMPGAGRAEAELRRGGYIREPASDDDRPVWRVSVEFSAAYIDEILVKAATEQEARRLARAEIERQPTCFNPEHIEIHGATATRTDGCLPPDIVAGEDD